MTIVHEDPDIPPLLANPQTFVIDPVFASSVEIDRDPVAVGQPTTGPNRFTAWIPTEHTVLSLGEASGRWETDHGIDGYTDTHIHFETTKGARTVVSLGGPATKSTLSGYRGAPPVSTHGYSMVTVENAWHDAQQQHYLFSRQEDITLRTRGEGKRAVIQAEHGTVDLTGVVEVNITGGGIGIGAHTGAPMEDIGYAGHWGGETPHSLKAKRAAQYATIMNTMATLHNLLTGAVNMYKERHKYKHGNHLNVTEIFGDFGEWALDAVEFYRAKGEIEELFAEEESPEAAIKIDAEKDFGISAGGSVSFFGMTATTMAAKLWASASALGYAGLSGILFGGVAGTFTSLKGYKKVEIGCDHGEVALCAKKDVNIAATENFIATGKEIAMIKGEKTLYLAGATRAWIGTAAGGGWGLDLSSAGLSIGKASSAGSMKSASVADDRSIKMATKSIKLQSSSTKMHFQNTKIETEANTVDLESEGDFFFGGKKVLIDA